MIIPGKSRSLAPPIGVIDSLASGLETVATYLPLLLPPLLLDAILWLGPRVSFQPLLAWLGGFVAGDFDAASLPILIFVLNLGFPFFSLYMGFPFFPNHQEVWSPIFSAIAQNEPKNYTGILEALKGIPQAAQDQYLSVGVMPSMVAGRDSRLLPFGYMPPVWQIGTPFEALVLRLLLLAVGIAVVIIYLASIAQRVKEGRNTLGWMVRRVPLVLIQVVIALILLLVLTTAAMFMLSMVLSVIVLLGSIVGGDQVANSLSAAIFALVMLIGIWAVLLMAFTVHGMLLNDRGVFPAMWDSLRVVQWNISSTLGLFLVILVVTWAMGYVRGWMDPGSWLMPVGIVVNAFISTGLLAATFVFFKDRYRYWRELRDELLAELERRRTQQNKA